MENDKNEKSLRNGRTKLDSFCLSDALCEEVCALRPNLGIVSSDTPRYAEIRDTSRNAALMTSFLNEQRRLVLSLYTAHLDIRVCVWACACVRTHLCV